MIERILARGFDRRVEADIVRTRFERSAIMDRIPGVGYFVRRVDGRWAVFERKQAKR